jgi:hypothetical protein
MAGVALIMVGAAVLAMVGHLAEGKVGRRCQGAAVLVGGAEVVAVRVVADCRRGTVQCLLHR